MHAINLAGARIARHAARDAAWVAGSIGPLGVRVEPWGKTGLDEAQAIFAEQAAALAEGGVDLFVLETFRDVNEIGAAIRAIRAVSRRRSSPCSRRQRTATRSMARPRSSSGRSSRSSAPTCSA